MKTFLNESMINFEKEKSKLNEIGNNLYNKWLELKRIRENQGYKNIIKNNRIRHNYRYIIFRGKENNNSFN